MNLTQIEKVSKVYDCNECVIRLTVPSAHFKYKKLEFEWPEVKLKTVYPKTFIKFVKILKNGTLSTAKVGFKFFIIRKIGENFIEFYVENNNSELVLTDEDGYIYYRIKMGKKFVNVRSEKTLINMYNEAINNFNKLLMEKKEEYNRVVAQRVLFEKKIKLSNCYKVGGKIKCKDCCNKGKCMPYNIPNVDYSLEYKKQKIQERIKKRLAKERIELPNVVRFALMNATSYKHFSEVLRAIKYKQFAKLDYGFSKIGDCYKSWKVLLVNPSKDMTIKPVFVYEVLKKNGWKLKKSQKSYVYIVGKSIDSGD